MIKYRHISDRIKRMGMALAAMLVLVACGDSETFTIEGTIKDNPTMNLRFVYYSGGALQRGVTAVRDGKFEYKGVAPTPTIVEISDNDYRPLGRLYVTNGDRISCQLVRNAPAAITVKGSDVNQRWARFLNENMTVPKALRANEMIEEYVKDNPDDIVSTLLMVTMYDASRNALRADSVMSSIDQSARPAALVESFNTLLQRLVDNSATEAVVRIPYFNRRDSLVDFDPARRAMSVIVLSDANSGRSDSIVDVLRRLSRKKLRERLQVVDFSLDRDTMTWHKSTAADSATWSQGWVAGSIAASGVERLGVPSLPYFIVTDSTGAQVLRSYSVSRLEEYVDSCLTIEK